MIHSFKALLEKFEEKFSERIFPGSPINLYDPAQYILQLGGKRVRPVLCLMGNELFNDLHEDAYSVAVAVELFHNFTLVHDDIMDEAPLRRGKPTVHKTFGEDSAILAGDVMLIQSYLQINEVNDRFLKRIIHIFSKTAREVCEGQQLDMDYAALPLQEVSMDAYLHMIALKTSVLLAGSLQMGGVLGGGSEGNLMHLYSFGKNLGIAFQIQDDYLDAFGDPRKTGKQAGGDILVNKKTFLLIKAWELGDQTQRQQIEVLLNENDPDKVGKMLCIYHNLKLDQWAKEEKRRFMEKARGYLENVAVLSSRKKELGNLIDMLLDRES